MKFQFQDNDYYIVPNILKEKILQAQEKEPNLYQIHFDTKESFFEKYLFKIKEEAILFLLEENETMDTIAAILSSC